MKKRLIQIAHEIVALEKEFFNGGKAADFSARFDKITNKLTAKEMFEIDAYICENNLLADIKPLT
jgi:hypothetical protein